MTLRLSRAAGSSIPVEVPGVTPDRLRDRSLAEIEQLEIFHGNSKAPLAELFRVSGDLSDGRIEFDGDLGGVHHIGHAMGAGEIRVQGDAGRHLGAEMTGGVIRVEGNAGDWVGAEMKGGFIHIAGSAGDHAGSVYPGTGRDDRGHDPHRRIGGR